MSVTMKDSIPAPNHSGIESYNFKSQKNGEKTTCLKNIFDSRLYQFILFTFVFKLLHKIFFKIFTVNFTLKVKILWEKIFSMNDSK